MGAAEAEAGKTNLNPENGWAIQMAAAELQIILHNLCKNGETNEKTHAAVAAEAAKRLCFRPDSGDWHL